MSHDRRPVRILELRSAEGAGGGPEKTIREHARLADRDRYEIAVCYVHTDAEQDFEIAAQAREAGLDYIAIRWRRGFIRDVFRRIARIVRQREIDVVHAHDYKTDLIALLASRKTAAVAMSTAHGFTGHSLRERLLYYPLDRRVLLPRFSRVIAVSGQLRDTLIASGVAGDRIVVIPNGIDHERIRRKPGAEFDARRKFGFGPDDVIIGSVGRLEPQKRFDLLIEAFADLRRRDSRLRLVIAGEGSQRERLQRQIARLDVQDGCRLLGHVSEVATFYHALDLFAQSSDYEGTPNVVLEAMAYEVPVVATEAGGTAELVDDGLHGRMIPIGDSLALGRAIAESLGDHTTTAAQVRAARRRVETDLSFRQRMRRVESIYDELAPRDAHPKECSPSAQTVAADAP